ncbi:hypothetical protein HKX48_007923 [Thoreauomyces humboldtii]|nr:hypothetical protein HKX48_007923 [Thoreauomyces humboldtii]
MPTVSASTDASELTSHRRGSTQSVGSDDHHHVHRYLFGVVATPSRYKFFSLQLEDSSVHLPLSQVRILISNRLSINPNASAADDLCLYRFEEDLETTDPRLASVGTESPTASFRLTLLPESLHDVATWIPNLEKRNLLHVLVTLPEASPHPHAGHLIVGDAAGFLEDLPPPAYSHAEGSTLPVLPSIRTSIPVPAVVAAVCVPTFPQPAIQLRKMDHQAISRETSPVAASAPRDRNSFQKRNSPSLPDPVPAADPLGGTAPWERISPEGVNASGPSAPQRDSTYDDLMISISRMEGKDPDGTDPLVSVSHGRRRRLILGVSFALLAVVIGGAVVGYTISKDKNGHANVASPLASVTGSRTVSPTSSVATPTSTRFTWFSLNGYDSEETFWPLAATSLETCQQACEALWACHAAVWDANQGLASCKSKNSLGYLDLADSIDSQITFRNDTYYRRNWTTLSDTAFHLAPNTPESSFYRVNYTGVDEAVGGSLCAMVETCIAFDFRYDTRSGSLFTDPHFDPRRYRVDRANSTGWIKPVYNWTSSSATATATATRAVVARFDLTPQRGKGW